MVSLGKRVLLGTLRPSEHGLVVEHVDNVPNALSSILAQNQKPA